MHLLLVAMPLATSSDAIVTSIGIDDIDGDQPF